MNSAQTKLKNWLQKNSTYDGICITKKENITWLTGFSGSFGVFIGKKDGKNYLITDSRYAERAQKCAKENNCEFVVWDEDFQKNFGEKLKGNFAIESSISVKNYEKIKKDFPQAHFIPEDSTIEKLRIQKTEEEIEKIHIAQHQVDQVLVPFLQANGKEGISEKYIAFQLEIALRDNGKFELSFPVIVAFGPNSSIPHHKPGNQKLKKGDNILIDCGVKFEGYCSDMTRNFGYGSVSDEYRAKYELLLKAQEKTLEKYQVGTTPKQLDEYCRELIGAEAEYFTHSLGHGVGLEIHELPGLGKKSEELLVKNSIVTCEPGLYYPGKFGIRIEDLVVITKDGPEILSTTKKDLVII